MLFGGTVLPNCVLFGGTVPPNSFFLISMINLNIKNRARLFLTGLPMRDTIIKETPDKSGFLQGGSVRVRYGQLWSVLVN